MKFITFIFLFNLFSNPLLIASDNNQSEVQNLLDSGIEYLEHQTPCSNIPKILKTKYLTNSNVLGYTSNTKKTEGGDSLSPYIFMVFSGKHFNTPKTYGNCTLVFSIKLLLKEKFNNKVILHEGGQNFGQPNPFGESQNNSDFKSFCNLAQSLGEFDEWMKMDPFFKDLTKEILNEHEVVVLENIELRDNLLFIDFPSQDAIDELNINEELKEDTFFTIKKR